MGNECCVDARDKLLKNRPNQDKRTCPNIFIQNTCIRPPQSVRKKESKLRRNSPLKIISIEEFKDNDDTGKNS